MTQEEVADRVNDYWLKRGVLAKARTAETVFKTRMSAVKMTTVVSALKGWEHDPTAEQSFDQARQISRRRHHPTWAY